MIVFTRKIWLLLSLLLILIGGGCRSPISREPLPEEWDGSLRLMLRVFTGESPGIRTRAVTPPDGYEYPDLATEKLNSLRVIIVNNNPASEKYGRIIHNRYVSITALTDKYRFIEPFEVDFNTQYKIYLIGNEAGITGLPNRGLLFTDTLAADKLYPAGKLESIVLDSGAPGYPLIDNSEADSGKLPVPMTESFEITTRQRPQTDAEAVTYTEEHSFFLTRTASKFSFQFFRGDDIFNQDVSVKAVRLSGLGQKEYLFPNGTQYVPAKYYADNTVNTTLQRYITSFSLPDSPATGAYTFTLGQVALKDLPLMPDEQKPQTGGYLFAPELYFPESYGAGGDTPFQCSVSFDGVTFLPPVTLPALSILPRNTHVMINITFHEIGFKITVAPWEFGGDTEIDMGELEQQ